MINGETYSIEANNCDGCICRPIELKKCQAQGCIRTWIHKPIKHMKCANCGTPTELYQTNKSGEIHQCNKCLWKCKAVNNTLENSIERDYTQMCEENAENIKRNLPVVVLQKDVTFRRRIKEKKVDHLFNKKICIHCGKEFSAKRGDAKTCGTRCRVAAARAKHKPDSRKPFSIKEIMLLQQIGQLVLNNLEFEKEADEYRANYENWMCNLSKDDYKTLKIAVKK